MCANIKGYLSVKIIKANKPTYWYAHGIGQIYTVRRGLFYVDYPEPFDGYTVVDSSGREEYLFIDLDDAEPVEVTDFVPN